jgi:CubicO group peptidase (beta-lactamase class C family)
MVRWLIVVAAAHLTTEGLVSAQAEPLRGLDRYVTDALAQWRVPGVAVAVVRGDSVIVARGYGVKQIHRADPVTARTMFEIGSTSKAFSSALLAMLVDDGAVGWDDLVTKHLPWFELKDPYLTRSTTIRDLLSHRVGVTGAFNGYISSTREEVIRRNRFLEPVVPFRSRYDYSNMMYATAGEVAAAVVRQPWEALLRDRLLTPLGMTETTTDIARFFDSTRFARCFYCPFPRDPVSLDHVLGKHDAAMPHLMRGDTVHPIPWQSYDNAVSAGSIISNVTEMAEWLRLLLGQGTYRGRQLIKPETFRELHRPQSLITPTGWIDLVARASPSTHFWAYGLGWRMNDYRGRRIVWHTGGIAGFLAYVGLLPEERLGVVILSNGDLGYELLPQSVGYWIYDSHIGAPVRDWTAELVPLMAADRRRLDEAQAKLAASRERGTSPSRPLEWFAGRYASDIFGRVSVRADGDRLTFEIDGGAAGELVHWHRDVFRLQLNASNRGNYFTRFPPGPDGAPDQMVVDGLGQFARAR